MLPRKGKKVNKGGCAMMFLHGFQLVFDVSLRNLPPDSQEWFGRIGYSEQIR